MYYSISYDIKYDIKSNLYDSSMYIKTGYERSITLGKLAKGVSSFHVIVNSKKAINLLFRNQE
ncbi:hypothetical protein [Rickettsia massiliae]|uniref:hypothetical protein n=1 Tax=Rickettsia massiliae TaxID=35791 RepID=UPI000319C019|nr:hypothetical protein [Rickettsia massiliae]